MSDNGAGPDKSRGYLTPGVMGCDVILRRPPRAYLFLFALRATRADGREGSIASLQRCWWYFSLRARARAVLYRWKAALRISANDQRAREVLGKYWMCDDATVDRGNCKYYFACVAETRYAHEALSISFVAGKVY